jgi:hypothetical protein
MGGYVGPRTGLDDVERRKILTLLDLKSNPSAVQPVAIPTALSQLELREEIKIYTLVPLNLPSQI